MSILLDDAESADTYRQMWFEGTTDELPSVRVRRSIVKATAKKILIELQAIYNLPDGGMFHNKMGEFIKSLREEVE